MHYYQCYHKYCIMNVVAAIMTASSVLANIQLCSSQQQARLSQQSNRLHHSQRCIAAWREPEALLEAAIAAAA